ncbi:arginase family protein [Flavisolibacter tropicus]|uniref:Arginase n=1 Tax=Flavisolibacter tropicus TaxID=1492898 RepID=A0A172TY56_9BACT|nr:arginase family protein [Flavisolibacter tropicus]ANE52015.1 arginase [Flavisolibacter tropicus]
MSDYLNIEDFLEPINKDMLSEDMGYKDNQIGKVIDAYEEGFPDLDRADIVILGCGEQRGAGLMTRSEAADEVRKEFYKLFYWHTDVNLADIGNLRIGNNLNDTYAALKMVVHELVAIGKLVVVIGGSHDLTLGQYQAFVDDKKSIDAVGVDAIIDINIDSPFRSDKFLMDLFTGEPNYMNHYNHLAFQSYFVHPRMLETMDKLRFDCFRVGVVKDRIEEMEPVIRNCHLFSFDMAAIANAFAPANTASPNGLNGEEACTLMQFAGMSPNMQTVGIFGYQPENDKESLTAKQISHMLWYLMDGHSRGTREASLDDRESFNEFHMTFAEVETLFLQSKKTGRWWMQLPDQKFIACSHRDYIAASQNELPERWLRAQERP